MLKLLAFTLPLCLDTFAVAFAVLGEMRLTRAQRIRVIVLFIAFEAGMPLAGMALGAPLTHLTGSPSHLVSTLTSSAARPRPYPSPGLPKLTWPTPST
jgi:putative Mn2+ efflux pump MntP